MSNFLNYLARLYVRHSPITEGKNSLFRLINKSWVPTDLICWASVKRGFSLKVNLSNPEHRRLFLYGDHDERYEATVVSKLVRNGDICWDVGANIGFYSCMFAKLVGPSGNVIAFEPASTARAFLVESIAYNGFTNIEVVDKALGDQDGSAEIFFGDIEHAEGTASMLASSNKGYSERIAVTTLDSLAKSRPGPAFMKIDVEGLQLEVLRGGREMLTRHQPIIIAELRDGRVEVMGGVQRLLTEYGYRPFEMHKRHIQYCPNICISRKRNFLLVPSGGPMVSRLTNMISSE